MGAMRNEGGTCISSTMALALKAENITDSDRVRLQPLAEAYGGNTKNAGREVKGLASANVEGRCIYKSNEFQWRGQAYKVASLPATAASIPLPTGQLAARRIKSNFSPGSSQM
jgi:hypothetical protein